MEKYLYSIYDSVSKEFCGPWLDNNDGAAARRFSSWISQNSSQPNFKSTDYYLYKVASFDVGKGFINPCLEEIAINEGDND